MIQDIVCGMYFVSAEGAKHLSMDNTDYYFCCDICKAEFQKNPSKYIEEIAVPLTDNDASYSYDWDRDPVCGETLKISEARGISFYKNSKYYFCCIICKKVFDANPSAFADKEEGYYDPANPNDLLSSVSRIL